MSSDVDLIVKVVKGLENLTASIIQEISPGSSVRVVGPGVIFVRAEDKYKLAEELSGKAPEASRILIVEAKSRSKIDEIVRAAVEVAERYIKEGDTFAVRTTRRGSHDFTSIDVNVAVGAAIQKATGAEVDLDFPTKPIYIEIFGEDSYVCTPATPEYHRMFPGKPLVHDVLSKMTIAQLVYEGPREATRKMGVRIGRAAQTFEVGELYIVYHRPIPAETLKEFIEGVFEGLESRYEIQRRSYGRPTRRVPVYVYELYQFVRIKRGEPIIVTDPKGDYVVHVKDKLAELFKRERVNVLIGAREGIPIGIFRFADLVVDLIPDVTISTDYALTSTVIAFISALEEVGALEHYVKKKVRRR